MIKHFLNSALRPLILMAALANMLALPASAATVVDTVPRVAVLSAFGPELDLLLDQLTDARKHTINGVTFTTGRLKDKPVVLFLSGISMTNAAMNAQLAIDCFKLTDIVVSGIAGAEYPTPVAAALAGQRPQQNHGVQVHVRVQKGESHTGCQRRAQRRPAGRVKLQPVRLECAPCRSQAIDHEDDRAAITRHIEEQRYRCNQGAQTGDAGRDQQRVRAGANKDDSEDMLTPETLAQDEGILGADGDDQHGAGQETGDQVGAHAVSSRRALRRAATGISVIGNVPH